MAIPIDAILVPQGAEYKAVCKGLKQVDVPTPPIFSIPVGALPVTQYLEKWLQLGHLSNSSQPKVLLMGLGGSLSPRYKVGDVVVYKDCIKGIETINCNFELTNWVQSQLKEAYLGVGLTSDRVISSSQEKRHLGNLYNTDVVDMEGFAVLNLLNQAEIEVGMLRVISDDCNSDIPDLLAAFSADGSLLPIPLALSMLRQPIAAIRLIRDSLKGLRVLEEVTTILFKNNGN